MHDDNEKKYTPKEIREFWSVFFKIMSEFSEKEHEIRKKENEIKSVENIKKWIENNKKGMFKVKIWYNAAETSRDADNICVLEEKYFSKSTSAVEYMKKYIKENFINADAVRIIDKALICSDITSWGRNITVNKVDIIM